MLVVKFQRLWKRLYSNYSIAESRASYLHSRLDSFLSSDGLDSRSVVSAHGYIIATGNAQNRFIASKLIALYAWLNQPCSSTAVFESLGVKDPFLWNSIIKAHFGNGNYERAVEYFFHMRLCGSLPDQFTTPMVVSACAELGLLSDGMIVHGLVSKLNLFSLNSAVGASLMYMYVKCGDLEDACHVFDEMAVKDVVAWTVLVVGYVQAGKSYRALECLREMHRSGGDGERPNSRTLDAGFRACGDSGALSEVLSMYSKCQRIDDVQVSFCEVVDKDLFSWTSLVKAYARIGRVRECFEMFQRMVASGVYPDGMAIGCLLSGFANSMMVFEGMAFHGFILRRKYEVDRIVRNSLLSMYCKFGLVTLAEKIFYGGCDQDKDAWNLMIVGYEKSRSEMECIKLFRAMQHQGIESDLNCLISVISSCSRLGVINFGKSIHCHVMKTFACENVSVANSLISMYGNCGNLSAAQSLFCRTAPDIATWNSLISSYAVNGSFFEALNILFEMFSKGLKPNSATLAISLSACAQSASLEQGRKIHDYIREAGFGYSVSLGTALVDMYAKCGEINTAKEIFDAMEEKDVVSWTVMISCYGMHGQGKSAVRIFQEMEESGMRPHDLAFLAVLSACAHAGLADDAEYLFDRMKGYSIAPTLQHYACMVDVYGKLGRLHEAESLILKMPFPPDGGIWGSLLTACKTHNNAEMGVKIAKRAIDVNPENDGYYISLSDFYSSMEMWEGVEQVRQMMKDRGVRKTIGWSTV
ncbi:pentatricopeptide repeat-containing protein At4g39952, mitochondrial isoform X2 [Andrographis paniculata]|uniref:pentatricopeptide repeat-containing protein At4g39952, mitochondrial isoform X2 n=1 Tax=Andrographis paniculata TaxID=175694 RepID=UPI0021E788DD|nr:pentatricopeptide repeat-containing protein At4g39952, mitochondrial isoform X2 [Andrographis paniculata]